MKRVALAHSTAKAEMQPVPSEEGGGAASTMKESKNTCTQPLLSHGITRDEFALTARTQASQMLKPQDQMDWGRCKEVV